MVKVKSNADIKTNYTSGANVASVRYKQGVSTAEWQGQALKGQALYVAMMQQAEVLARRAAGISKQTDANWRAAATDKGAPIIGARMIAAADKQVSNFAPYKAALESLTLPDKTVDPMQNLINRAGAVVQALVNTKKQQG